MTFQWCHKLTVKFTLSPFTSLTESLHNFSANSSEVMKPFFQTRICIMVVASWIAFWIISLIYLNSLAVLQFISLMKISIPCSYMHTLSITPTSRKQSYCYRVTEKNVEKTFFFEGRVGEWSATNMKGPAACRLHAFIRKTQMFHPAHHVCVSEL